MQAELAQEISGLIGARPVTDARFAWPSYEEVKVISDSPRYRGEQESVVVTPDGERPSPGEVRRAKQLIKNARDVIAIPGTDEHPPYLIDLKARRASIVEDRKLVTVLRDADPEGAGAAMTYLFPRRRASGWGSRATRGTARTSRWSGSMQPQALRSLQKSTAMRARSCFTGGFRCRRPAAAMPRRSYAGCQCAHSPPRSPS